jgi:hypothetical protein
MKNALASFVAALGLAAAVLSAQRAPAPKAPGAQQGLADIRLFPPDDPWNQDVSKEPVDPNSDVLIASIGADTPLHPAFGTEFEGVPNGIPYVVVGGNQPKVKVEFEYNDESDAGPYPVPPDAPIEGGPKSEGDRHVLVVDRENHKLYELFAAYPQDGGTWWKAGSGAVWDLKKVSVGQRPKGWTSADAAGLPVLPGLVRYEEVEEGVVRHALRFTVRNSRRGYVYPATHFASRKTDRNLPPMGMRVRLKAGYDLSRFSPRARVILQALKTHGMILADNGSNWYLNGVPDPRWDDAELRQLRRVKGSDFEVVKMGEVVTR